MSTYVYISAQAEKKGSHPLLIIKRNIKPHEKLQFWKAPSKL